MARKYNPADESIVLEKIRAGGMVVDTVNGLVYLKARSGELVLAAECERGRCGTYRGVHLCHKGARRKVAVHRAVWIAAYGQMPPEGMQINHKDKDRANCSITNLEAVTIRENIDHRDGRDYDPFEDDEVVKFDRSSNYEMCE